MLNKIKNSKYFSNTLWLLGDKILKMFIGLFIMIYLARYLGSEQFGIFNYSLSIITLAGIFVYLGLSGILVHELVKNPLNSASILGTAFYMKLIGAFVAFLLLVLFALYTLDINSDKFYLLIIMGLGLFFRPFEVIDAYNESNVIAKYSVKARTYSFLITSFLKIMLIYTTASIVSISWTIPLEILLMSIFLLYYFYKNQHQSIINWKFHTAEAKKLILKSWKLIFSFIFVTIYLKIDQVMLSWMINDHAVGIYSVAATLSEAWYFIPAAIVASIFPKLIEGKKQGIKMYNLRLQQIYDFLFLIAIVIALIVTLYSDTIISLLYGKEYIESATILTIHIWAGIFVFMRVLFSRWIIIEDLLILSLYTQGFGALLNIGLNLLFIKEYGANGAAFATLLSYAGASYLSLFLHKSSRNQAKMMTLSLLLFFRIIIFRKKIWNR